MKTNDAAKILGLTGEVTPEKIKVAYQRAAMKFHPDRNPAGLEMMQAINAAYESLKDFQGDVQQEVCNYADELNAALNAIIECVGLKIEVCGAWAWVSGETYPHRATLKASAYRWASAKKMWYFRPEDWQSFSRGSLSIDEIRERHGSQEVKTRSRPAIQTGICQ